jgi:hypothetical protein
MLTTGNIGYSTKEIRLRLALFEDRDRTGLLPDEHRWIVRSLDHEMFGHGSSAREALVGAMKAFFFELKKADQEGRDPFLGVPPASKEFLGWWQSGAVQPIDVPRDIMKNVPERMRIEASFRENT